MRTSFGRAASPAECPQCCYSALRTRLFCNKMCSKEAHLQQLAPLRQRFFSGKHNSSLPLRCTTAHNQDGSSLWQRSAPRAAGGTAAARLLLQTHPGSPEKPSTGCPMKMCTAAPPASSASLDCSSASTLRRRGENIRQIPFGACAHYSASTAAGGARGGTLETLCDSGSGDELHCQ